MALSMMRKKIVYIRALSHLGYRMTDKIKFGALVLWPFIQKKLQYIGFRAEPKFRVTLSFEHMVQPLTLYGLHDEITLLYEIFVEQCYRVDTYAHDARVVIDAGANVGISTLYFRAVCPQAIIYAIEPDPRNYERLVSNIQGQDNIKPYEVAFSDTNGHSDFYVPADKIISSSLISRGGTQKKVRVRSVTLDDFVASEHIQKIDICKFDVEGAEYRMFKNCEALSRIDILIGEVHADLMGHTLSDFYKLIEPYVVVVRHDAQKEHRDFFYAVAHKTPSL